MNDSENADGKIFSSYAGIDAVLTDEQRAKVLAAAHTFEVEGEPILSEFLGFVSLHVAGRFTKDEFAEAVDEWLQDLAALFSNIPTADA